MGARAEWMHFISADKAFKLEAESKDLNYQKYKTLDGVESSAFAISGRFFQTSGLLVV